MTSPDLIGRVDRVERDMYEMGSDVRVLKNDVSTMKGDISTIASGINTLMNRDARRPEPLTPKTLFYSIVGASSGLVGVWAVVTFLIAASEPVDKLNKMVARVEVRMDKLDDPKDGKVAFLEARMAKAEHWITSVTPSPTFVTVAPAPRR